MPRLFCYSVIVFQTEGWPEAAEWIYLDAIRSNIASTAPGDPIIIDESNYWVQWSPPACSGSVTVAVVASEPVI